MRCLATHQANKIIILQKQKHRQKLSLMFIQKLYAVPQEGDTHKDQTKLKQMEIVNSMNFSMLLTDIARG